MNKSVIMVLAVIVTLLSGWLVLELASSGGNGIQTVEPIQQNEMNSQEGTTSIDEKNVNMSVKVLPIEQAEDIEVGVMVQ